MRTLISTKRKSGSRSAASRVFSNSRTSSIQKKAEEKCNCSHQPVIQTQLKIGRPGDRFEQEADRMADRVVNQQQGMSVNAGTVPGVQQKCEACGKEESVQRMAEEENVQAQAEEEVQAQAEEEVQAQAEEEVQAQAEEEVQAQPEEEVQAQAEEEVQAQAEEEVQAQEDEDVQTQEEEEVQANTAQTGGKATPNLQSALRASKGGGSPISDSVRGKMEQSFGTDFSGVRIHTGPAAVQMNRQLRSNAFANGKDIYFNHGKYNPHSTSGTHLLAHELTHTIQQGAVASKAQTPAIQKLHQTGTPRIQKNDAAYEGGTGVGAAIGRGSMRRGIAHGTTAMAKNCRGLYGCDVGFKFSKAYRGTYDHSNNAAHTIRGAYVKIESDYNHLVCGECNKIRLIQVVRNTTKGSNGQKVSAEPDNPVRKVRSGYGTPNAASKGWRIDTGTKMKNPFYDNAPGWDTQIGNTTRPAILWDAPANRMAARNAGKDFQTFFVCENGGTKKTIAGVDWGYFIDSTGHIMFEPARPKAFCGASQELKDSSKRWEKIPGMKNVNIDFKDEVPVAHHQNGTNVWFSLDSSVNVRQDAEIDSWVHYQEAMRKIRQHLLATNMKAKIVLHGYASTDGAAAYNQTLSLKRAEFIKNMLIIEGIPPALIEVQAHGESNELSPSELNRRVIIQTLTVR